MSLSPAAAPTDQSSQDISGLAPRYLPLPPFHADAIKKDMIFNIRKYNDSFGNTPPPYETQPMQDVYRHAVINHASRLLEHLVEVDEDRVAKICGNFSWGILALAARFAINPTTVGRALDFHRIAGHNARASHNTVQVFKLMPILVSLYFFNYTLLPIRRIFAARRIKRALETIRSSAKNNTRIGERDEEIIGGQKWEQCKWRTSKRKEY